MSGEQPRENYDRQSPRTSLEKRGAAIVAHLNSLERSPRTPMPFEAVWGVEVSDLEQTLLAAAEDAGYRSIGEFAEQNVDEFAKTLQKTLGISDSISNPEQEADEA
jgi:hypothetical protein